MRRLALVLATLLALTSTASAQSVGPFSKAGYPTSLVERPLTLPASTAELQLALSYAQLGELETWALGFGAAYAINDKLELGLGTGLILDPDFGWTEDLDFDVALSVVDTAMIDVAPRAQFSLLFGEGQNLFPGFNLGVDTRFVFIPQLALLVGHGLLDIAFDPSRVDLDLNVAFIVQPAPTFGILVSTQLASIAVSGDGNSSTSVGDFIPFGVDAVLAIDHKLDLVFGVLFPTIEDAGEVFAIRFGAALRL